MVYIQDGLNQIKGLTIYGPGKAESRVALVSINLAGWSSSDLSRTLDEDFGVMTRSGLHCAPMAHKVLGSYPSGAVRFSFGWYNNVDEIDRILMILDELSLKKA